MKGIITPLFLAEEFFHCNAYIITAFVRYHKTVIQLSF